MKGRGRNKGVSTPTGVVLLIAVAVLLAAAVAALTLELSDTVDEEARAGVNIEEGSYNLTVSVVTLDNSDYVLIRGADGLNVYETPASGVSPGEPVGDRDVFLNGTSTRVRLGSGGNAASGKLAVVGVIGPAPEGVTEDGGLTSNDPPDTAVETVVREYEYDLS